MKKFLNSILFASLSLFLFNCGGGGGGGLSNSYNSGSSSSGGTFLDSNNSATYNSTTASNHQGYDAYENVKGTSQSSHQNPFDVTNVYKAYGYGFSGSGKRIAILDKGELQQHCPPMEAYNNPANDFVKGFLVKHLNDIKETADTLFKS